MRIVVNPTYLTGLCSKLNAAASGLQAGKRSIARLSLPAMPPSTAKGVMDAVDRSRAALDLTGTTCIEMSKQLEKRKNFNPPEAYPTFEPTVRLTRDAQERAEQLMKRIKDKHASIKDDIAFVEDVELQYQLYQALGEKGFNHYINQADQRFDLARDLINERSWKEREERKAVAYYDGHERYLAKHHLGWAYPKGFLTGFGKADVALGATIYSLYGMIADQFSDKRKKMWHDLDMPTNTEAVGKALEYSLDHKGEMAKALVAWDTFKEGKIGEGLGAVTYSGALFVATGGAGTAVRSGGVALQAGRAEYAALGRMRLAARSADRLEAQSARFRKLAKESRLAARETGGTGRNRNFIETRAFTASATKETAEAARKRAEAARAWATANAAYTLKVRSARRAIASATTGFAIFDITQPTSWTNWLLSGFSFYSNAHSIAPRDRDVPPVEKAQEVLNDDVRRRFK